MDFFEQQARAHRKTKWLIVYFSLAVALIIAAIYFIVLLGGLYVGAQRHPGAGPPVFWDSRLFLWTALATLAVILGGCTYKIQELAEGGSVVAESLGGRRVAANTTDPDERKLLNVVEEMAIASGVPMPQVYVLDDEAGINAFAAGHTSSDAVVAVTHGALKLLTRDELQGVIGHEFSHILNGDMRLNLRLMGILFGILCIATIGRIFMRARGRNAAAPVFFGLLLMGVGSIGVFFGRLIQAAVSRQREFLADASSVQFTRNPLGLSGALQKIGGYGFGSWLTSEHAPDAGHLFFSNGTPRPLFRLMSTHPPLEERIRAIDPTWDGTFRRVDAKAIQAEEARRVREQPRPVFADGKMIVLGGLMAQQTEAVKKYALPAIGNATPLHLRYAEKLRNALPDNIRAAAREPLAAAALILALVLSRDENQRARQIAGIQTQFSPEVAAQTAALFPDVSAVAARARLPILNLALGALKQLTPAQYAQFSQTLDALIRADGKIELFEFVLQKIVTRHVDAQFRGARRAVIQFYSVKPLVPDCAVLLSALANLGSADTAQAQKAFAAGAPYLRSPDDSSLEWRPREQCDVNAIDAALHRLAQAAPQIKKNLLEACIHTIGADGLIQESEAELLRAIADTLDCPIPPFVAEDSPSE
ncbi:MAG TPA: M48 family metallopeptidase [Verrucomicrobiae bacterium]|nr:M48 family metallopeptidase [Verrucomicrobiae bacterium]